MQSTTDSVGRVVVPKALRDSLGLTPGMKVDISRYGAGLQLLPAGWTARLVYEGGVPVVAGDDVIDDETVFSLIDPSRLIDERFDTSIVLSAGSAARFGGLGIR